jgi:hypothetical protein
MDEAGESDLAKTAGLSPLLVVTAGGRAEGFSGSFDVVF